MTNRCKYCGAELISIPRHIYSDLTDFIFNSAAVYRQEHSDMLSRWEEERIDKLVDFFSAIEPTLNQQTTIETGATR